MFRSMSVRISLITLCLFGLLAGSESWLSQQGVTVTSVASAQAAAEPDAESAAQEAKKSESMLVWLYNALGLRYVVSFLFLSFVFVAVLVMNLLGARRESVCPTMFAEQFEAHLNEKRFQEAYELAKNDESLLGKVLAAGMSKLSNGFEQTTTAMQEAGEDENMKIEHRLSYLALIGTLGPMVGLLGTVDGMIGSFTVIANSSTSPKPSQLASGISMAMVTTLVGLVLAIPAIAAFNILKNRFARLVLEAGTISGNLMGRFEKK